MCVGGGVTVCNLETMQLFEMLYKGNQLSAEHVIIVEHSSGSRETKVVPASVRVRLYWNKSDIVSRWVLRESNLTFTLSSVKEKTFCLRVLPV